MIQASLKQPPVALAATGATTGAKKAIVFIEGSETVVVVAQFGSIHQYAVITEVAAKRSVVPQLATDQHRTAWWTKMFGVG